MSDIQELRKRLDELCADAAGEDIGGEWPLMLTDALADAALAAGVEDWWDYYGQPDIEAITKVLSRKISELLIVEIARINGT